MADWALLKLVRNEFSPIARDNVALRAIQQTHQSPSEDNLNGATTEPLRLSLPSRLESLHLRSQSAQSSPQANPPFTAAQSPGFCQQLMPFTEAPQDVLPRPCILQPPSQKERAIIVIQKKGKKDYGCAYHLYGQAKTGLSDELQLHTRVCRFVLHLASGLTLRIAEENNITLVVHKLSPSVRTKAAHLKHRTQLTRQAL